MNQTDKTQQLIESANSILITSHISPDSDAISSALLLALSIKYNYPNKVAQVIIEEHPALAVDFLNGYNQIKFGNLLDGLRTQMPKLLVIVDANNYQRCSRNDAEEIAQFVTQNNIKTLIIDHHEPVDRLECDIYINQGSPACVQDVYELCFRDLGLKKPPNYQDIAILGILTDTARFKYSNPRYADTFKVVTQLIDDGADIEKIESKLISYSLGALKVIAELAYNSRQSGDFNYSYISDDFLKNIDEQSVTFADIKIGCDVFTSEFIRSIGLNHWGFIIYPDLNASQKTYSASFRSLSGVKDVAQLAASLGGGGHKSAAGVKLHVETIQDALQIVLQKAQASL